MLFILTFALGGAFGWRLAARRGGDRLDKLQYAAVLGIAFALVGLAATIVAQRLGFF